MPSEELMANQFLRKNEEIAFAGWDHSIAGRNRLPASTWCDSKNWPVVFSR
jgi:hypothetical protein